MAREAGDGGDHQPPEPPTMIFDIHDPADLLPPQGKQHYLQLRGAADDASAITHGLASRLIEENQRRQTVSLRLAQIRAQRVGDDHPEMVAMTRALADAVAEIERINARVAQHNLTAAPRSTLLRNIDAWLRTMAANHDFEDMEPEPVKLLRGEQIPTGLDRHRRRLRELDSDRARVEASPYPSSHAKMIAANYIDQLAEAATPVVSSLIEHGGPLVVDGAVVEPPIVFSETKLVEMKVATSAGEGVSTGYQVDPVGLMAFLFRDQMLARINELVDLESDDKVALSREQRAEQLATIASDRQAVEIDEGRLLRAGFGTTEPRADMSPSAFLLVKAVPKAARRSSRDHADAVADARRAREAAESRPTMPGTPS
ncbi:MAG: hypothetical protein C0480_10105 [Bradyrhizobium sp.]|nr:hypothetical protein [Bradyrhizobium sp.]